MTDETRNREPSKTWAVKKHRRNASHATSRAETARLRLELDDYLPNWRDTVKKGQYATGAGWLESLGEDALKLITDRGKEYSKNPSRYYYTHDNEKLFGYFRSPLVLCHGKIERNIYNYPPNVSPRLIQLIDYITNNPDKWQTGFMKQFTGGYPQDFRYSAFLNRTDHLQCGLYEVFRVVATDNNYAYCTKHLYSMGVGFKSVNQPNPARDTEINTGTLRTEPLSNKGAPFVYSGINLSDQNKSIEEIENKMTVQFPLEEHYNEHLSEGGDLFAININVINMKSKDMPPPAILKQKVGFGDYICLVGPVADEVSYLTGVMTQRKMSNGRRTCIHDIVLTTNRSASFIHLSQMDGAFGNNKKEIVNDPRVEDNKILRGYFSNDNMNSETAIESLRHKKTRNLPSEKVRVMESMTINEMVNMMTGIATAKEEGLDIGEKDRTPEGKSIEYIPTWKDNRRAIEINRGSAYSDNVRCNECNQKVKIKLPANNKLETFACPSCNSTDGLKIGHLVEGNPGREISGARPYR